MTILWADRDMVQNAEQALEALADFLSTDDTIGAAVEEAVGGNSDADKLRDIYNAVDATVGGNYFGVAQAIARTRVNIQLDAAEAFAAKWKIPWNRALVVKIFAKLENKHRSYEGRWYRSSADC